MKFPLGVLLIAVLSGPVSAQPSSIVTEAATEQTTLRAQLRSRQFATLAAGLSGEISRMPVREGDVLAQGALVAAIDCSGHVAARKVAEARLTAAKAKARVNQRLSELNSASILEVELAKAEVAQVTAEISAVDATLRKCEVKAPFPGIVVAQAARAHQFVREGEPLVELYDIANMEVELIVPSRWLEWLKVGHKFAMTVDELQRDIPAVVDRIAGRVDPVSQTVRVIGRVEGGPKDVLPGMSGTVRFSRS